MKQNLRQAAPGHPHGGLSRQVAAHICHSLKGTVQATTWLPERCLESAEDSRIIVTNIYTPYLQMLRHFLATSGSCKTAMFDQSQHNRHLHANVSLLLNTQRQTALPVQVMPTSMPTIICGPILARPQLMRSRPRKSSNYGLLSSKL